MSAYFDSRPIQERPPPDDAMGGPDPTVTVSTREVTLTAYVCSACGYTVHGHHDGLLRDHIGLVHSASRNPDLTCHAEHVASRGWCIRPKGHDGDHWTPDFHDGRWWED